MAHDVSEDEVTNAISVLVRLRQKMSEELAGIDGDEDDEIEWATMVIERRAALKTATKLLQEWLDGNDD